MTSPRSSPTPTPTRTPTRAIPRTPRRSPPRSARDRERRRLRRLHGQAAQHQLEPAAATCSTVAQSVGVTGPTPTRTSGTDPDYVTGAARAIEATWPRTIRPTRARSRPTCSHVPGRVPAVHRHARHDQGEVRGTRSPTPNGSPGYLVAGGRAAPGHAGIVRPGDRGRQRPQPGRHRRHRRRDHARGRSGCCCTTRRSPARSPSRSGTSPPPPACRWSAWPRPSPPGEPTSRAWQIDQARAILAALGG